MVTTNHQESCGVCHQAPCGCKLPIDWWATEGRVRLYVGFVGKGPEADANAQDLRLAGWVPKAELEQQAADALSRLRSKTIEICGLYAPDVLESSESELFSMLELEVNSEWERAELAEKRLTEATAEAERLVAAGGRLGEARRLLRRMVKYAREDRATTAGTTRLARLTDQVDDYLQRTHDRKAILRAENDAPSEPTETANETESPDAGVLRSADPIDGGMRRADMLDRGTDAALPQVHEQADSSAGIRGVPGASPAAVSEHTETAGSEDWSKVEHGPFSGPEHSLGGGGVSHELNEYTFCVRCKQFDPARPCSGEPAQPSPSAIDNPTAQLRAEIVAALRKAANASDMSAPSDWLRALASALEKGGSK